MSDKSFTFKNNRSGEEADLASYKGTLGPEVVDVRSLYGEQGIFTFDPGFASTASCESTITFIDGEEGILLYRGYPVEQLAQKSSFIEVCYLLLYGELPTQAELSKFENNIRRHTMINETMLRLFNGFHHDAHPMAMVSGVVGSMSAFYHETMDIQSARRREIFSHRIIAKLPTIAAAAYKHTLGQSFMYPHNDLDYASNLLHMFFAVPAEDYEIDPVAAEAIDLLLILHADHEQNCSTSTVRLAGSSGANPYSAIAAGIAALWGPAHGGANEAVLTMLEEIGSAKNIPEYVTRAKDKDDPFRLMGFGHRVYKNFDPRAKIIKGACFDVLDKMGIHSRLLEIAVELEEIALKDEYFIERKLYPNVDFYSGVIYNAIGTPSNMFTAMFAIGRLPGWIAHWVEMHGDPAFKIGRPRQVYTGSLRTDYTPLDQR